MSLKDETQTHQTAGGDVVRKRSKRRRCGAHCKRFWWAYLIAFACVVVLVVCLVIFVGVPNIAQDKLNEAELDIQGVNILNTEPNKFLMEVNSTITTDGSIHADVDAFTGRMYLEDHEPHVAFATLDFPETSADKMQVVNISQEVTVADMDAFVRFNEWFVERETLRLTIEGETKVKPAGLDRKYGVTFKKTLDVKGLNLLKGTEVLVDSAELFLSVDDNNRNFYGEADIPNPSHFTLEVGNVAFHQYIGDEDLGHLFIEDLILYPGSNTVNVSANLNQPRVLALLRTTPDYCKDGIIPFKLLAENVTRDGNDIEYFAKGLAVANQTVDIDIGAIIKNNLGTTIECADEED
ncbi:uncharacterized protein J7T54_005996 [Emericellopsis cladophorae]|uniref:Uncharacterized protein n=1 Tax=Emericellopsis cladophorae TaxID=2686198 RepID=A0A9Q0BHL1_9HYPO|nr:uncharacterized protein J7T54_005996 [Emericellopsis cladophorae]KAI6785662.1 hypothetical protein J7T54_005996 [Emericellopsis cladophorae]